MSVVDTALLIMYFLIISLSAMSLLANLVELIQEKMHRGRFFLEGVCQLFTILMTCWFISVI